MPLLYTTTDCLAHKPRECVPPNSTYYPLTRNGLDRIMATLFNLQDNMATMEDPEPTLGSAAFEVRF